MQQAAPAPSWGVRLGGWLASPLVVTVVAALLGSWLIPQLTREWQNHQESLEIKTSLVSQMSESVSGAVATGRFIASDLVPPKEQQREWNAGYRDWSTVSASVGAKLRAYVGQEIGAGWRRFADDLTNFLLLSSATDAESRRQQVQALRDDGDLRRHLTLSPAGWAALRQAKTSRDFQLVYSELARGILERRDELVQQVLDADVSGF
jgi:hypothetical protein